MAKITEMSFIKKVITSIKDFEKYTEIATQKVSDSFKYFLKLMVIFTILIVIASTYKSFNLISDMKEYLEKEIPNFSFEDNILKIDSEEPIRVEENKLLFASFIIDAKDISNEQIEKYKKEISSYTTGILFLKDKVIISTNPKFGIIEYSYKDFMDEYNIENLTKQNILDYFSGGVLVSLLIGIFIVNFIYAFMMYLISTLVYIVLIAILGYFTAIITKIRLKFSAMFNMAIHAFTLPTILFLIYIIVNMFTGFEIIYFDIMYTGVAYIYIIAAILMIKSDLIKRRQELEKIMEEQVKIAEEQKRKEEEERERAREEEKRRKKEEEKNKDKKDNKEENKKEGKNSKKNNDGLNGSNPEPQGNMFNG